MDQQNRIKKLEAYKRLMRMDKPIGTFLLLWPTLWALWLASAGHPDWTVVAIFTLGTFLMRSAGCVINDIADRNFDGHVERTHLRPLVSGEVSVKEALTLAAGLSLLAFGLVLTLNGLTILLSLPALLLAITYPYTKRFFAFPQAYLGIAFGFGIPMAFAAVQSAVPSEAWLMLLANVCWSLAYDTEYAMVDRDDDLRIGMKTSAITLGRYDVAAIMAFYAIFLVGWCVLLLPANLGWSWWVALALATVQAVWHGVLIKDRLRDGCFRAFRLNHWLGATVFVGVVAGYALH